MAALLILVQQVHTDVQLFGRQLEEQRHTEALLLAEAVADLMLKAFPEGDPEGHRKDHEAQLRAVEARAEFWRKMLFEISKYGLLGVVGWLAVKIWVAFLAGPTR
jgi:hypothetical protein